MEAGKLVFRRIGPQGFKEADAASPSGRAAISERHPLIGWMKGTVRIAPGVDLTEPADPEWGEQAWGDQK
jgi:hypothetical protein